MKEPYLSKWGDEDGHKVFIVDGGWIRRNKNIDFTDFGQHGEFKFIPKDEVWIDRTPHANEIAFFAKHAIEEQHKMAAGESKDKAIDQTAKDEDTARKKDEPDKGDPLRIRKLATFPPLTVWLVDGAVVRDKYRDDFTEGGHGRVYKFIPKNEVWIDDQISAKERPFIEIHEITEWVEMGKGLKYHPAHKIASRMELRARRDPKQASAILKREVARIKP